MNNLPIVEGRSCDGCTKCCEGYLTGIVNEKPFGLGEPCYLVQIGKGCGDYDNRPEYPCKLFQCEWLVNPDVPEEYKPSESNVIISTRYIDDNNKYLELTEAGEKLDSSILSWAIGYSLENENNLLWSISDESYWIGDEEFDGMMNGDGITEMIQESAAAAYFPPKFNEFEHYKFNFEDDSETD